MGYRMNKFPLFGEIIMEDLVGLWLCPMPKEDLLTIFKMVVQSLCMYFDLGCEN